MGFHFNRPALSNFPENESHSSGPELSAFAASAGFNLLPVPAWVYDMESLRFLAVNDIATEIYGYTREEFLASSILKIRPEEDVPVLLMLVDTGGDRPGHRGYWRHRYKDGRVVDVFVSTRQITLDGRCVAIAVLQDASAMKAAESDARQKDNLLQSIAQAVPSAVVVVAWADGRILFANKQLADIWPTPPNPDSSFQTISDFVKPTDWLRLLMMVEEQGCVDGYELQVFRCDGKILWVRLSARTVTYDNQRALLTLVSDITEEREREANNQRRQKMAALGLLAGRLAHEINNLLQPVVSLTNFHLTSNVLPRQVLEDFQDILTSVRQCRDLIHDVLSFARKENTAIEPLNLPEAVREALASIRHGLPDGVKLVCDISMVSGWVLIGRTELTQVLANLIHNASHAMADEGTVTVTLETPDHDPMICRLAIRDTGYGIDQEMQERIFEPFFTTKPPGQGTGLGLAVVHGIVQSWNGTIVLRSKPGHGTIFEISIPKVRT